MDAYLHTYPCNNPDCDYCERQVSRELHRRASDISLGNRR